MTERETVALREYVETLVAHESKLREEWARANERALLLQAAEYDRRLATLNGERQRQDQLQATYLTRAEYNLQHKILADMAQDNKEKLGRLESAGAGAWRLVTIFAAIVSLILGMILLAEQMGMLK